MPRTISAEGRTFTVPDDATPEEINQIAGAPKNTEAPGAAERFGTGLYQSTAKPLVDIGSGLISSPKETITGVGKGLLNTAFGTQNLGNAYREIKSGHPITGIIHGVESLNEGPAGRSARGMVEPIAEDVKQGNLAGAAGRIVGTAAQLFAGAKGAGKVPEIAEVPRIAGTAARTAGVGIRAAAPDVGMGVAKLGAAAGLEEAPIPNYVKYAAGVPSAVSGAKQIGSGLKKGFQAGREEFNAPQVQPIAGRIATPPPIPASPKATLAPGGEFSEVSQGPQPLPVSVPKSGLQPVGATVPAGPEPEVLDGLSRHLTGKPFAKLTPEEQATVTHVAEKSEVSPASRISGRVEPFAPTIHKSSATVARQLTGEGTMENQAIHSVQPQSAFENPSIPARNRIRALEISDQLSRLLGGK